MMWAAGAVAAMSSITFPAVSALVSRTADADQQGEWIGTLAACGKAGSEVARGPLTVWLLGCVHHCDKVPDRNSLLGLYWL